MNDTILFESKFDSMINRILRMIIKVENGINFAHTHRRIWWNSNTFCFGETRGHFTIALSSLRPKNLPAGVLSRSVLAKPKVSSVVHTVRMTSQRQFADVAERNTTTWYLTYVLLTQSYED
jgi:hypothetical protein